MSSLVIAAMAFGLVLIGTLIGMWVGRLLPDHHLSGESKDVVKQGLALIATLTALVLGLLVASTKGTFDSQSTTVKELAANVAVLDRALGRYGPETKEIRASLANLVQLMLDQMWPHDSGQAANLTSAEVRVSGEAVFDKIAALEPKTDTQRLLKGRALETVISLAQTRQRLLAQKESAIPVPFLAILGFWLTFLFGCYGLFAPRNLTVLSVLIVCMLSVTSALFLVLEMDRPFDGLVRIPSAPLRAALSRLGD